MDSKPLMVTIRCFYYNQERYVRQCLEGFVMQKTDFRFEAVVHDDASTDGTAGIILEYAEKYPDIIIPIIEKENLYSRHDGSLRKAMDEQMRGKYVAVCEGDDYWIDPFKLQKQVDFMEKHPEYSMCVHPAVEFYQDASKLAFVFPQFNKSQDINFKQLVEDWVVPTASILVKREVFPLPVWADKVYSGDMSLALMAFSKGKIFFMNEIMSFYRKHNAGVSSTSINPPDFVSHQKVSLYNYYNEETDYKYAEILNKKIEYYSKNAKMWEYRKKGLLYAIIKMPLFALSKFLNKH